MIKLNKFKLERKRGVSPVIAQILLIGIVMVAGAYTFSTVYVVMTTEDPLSVIIKDITDFKLSNSSSYSTKYDSFSILVENSGSRGVSLKGSDFKLFEDNISNPLVNWTMQNDQDVQSLQSTYIYINSNSSLKSNWLSINTTIIIELIAFESDESYNDADKITLNNDFFISTDVISFGPLKFKHNSSLGLNNFAILNILDPNQNALEIAIENYGGLYVNYTIEFVTSNRTLNLTINYVNSSVSLANYFSSSLDAAINDSPKSTSDLEPNGTLIISVLNQSEVAIGSDEFYITVWLKIESKIFDTLLIICKT